MEQFVLGGVSVREIPPSAPGTTPRQAHIEFIGHGHIGTYPVTVQITRTSVGGTAQEFGRTFINKPEPLVLAVLPWSLLDAPKKGHAGLLQPPHAREEARRQPGRLWQGPGRSQSPEKASGWPHNQDQEFFWPTGGWIQS